MAGRSSCDTASLISNVEEDQGNDVVVEVPEIAGCVATPAPCLQTQLLQRSTTTALLNTTNQEITDHSTSTSSQQRSNSLCEESIQQYLESFTNYGVQSGPQSTSVTIVCNSGSSNTTNMQQPDSITNIILSEDQENNETADLPEASSTLCNSFQRTMPSDTDGGTGNTLWEMNYHEAAIFLQVILLTGIFLSI